MKRILGPKPLIQYSHFAALKVFKGVGFKWEVRRSGESRLGLLRWPLRKLSAGIVPRRIVLAPGFGDTPLSWVSLLVALHPVVRRRFDEIIIIDYPGYNGFLHDEAAFDSMDELTRVFGEVIDSLKPSLLMGHSLGGWLAANYAAGAGDRLKELILFSPGGLIGTEEERKAYRELFLNAVNHGPDELATRGWVKKPRWLKLVEGQVFHFMKAPEVRSFLESFDEARHGLNTRVGLIQAKTTVLWGETDTITPTSWIYEWMKGLSVKAEPVGILIRKCGHSAHVEKPGVLMALMTQLFLGHEPATLKVFPFWRVIPKDGVL